MASKDKDSRPPRPGLKVVGRGAPDQPPAAEAIFSDKRSGRDRREEPGAKPDSRRSSPERRKGNVQQGAWWLERDYVESHHFVQKSASGRVRRRDPETPEE